MTTSDSIRASDTRLCVSPKWRMRNDSKRVVLYKYSTVESEWRIVPPQTALALSLFNGMRSLQDVSSELSGLVNIPLKDARQFLTKLLATYYTEDDPVLVKSDTIPHDDWCTYDTAKMIIPMSEFQAIKRLEAPLSLLLMPYNTCQVNCRYCYSERKSVKTSDLLTISRWRELIDEAADSGVDIASFSGGDPMLYPEIISLLDILIKRDFTFLMSTKTLVPKDTVLKLVDIGMGKRLFQISLDAWNPELADYMVRHNGYRDKAVQSIKNLVRYGIQVRTNTVCTPGNYRSAPDLMRHLIDLGVKTSSIAIYGRSLYLHNDSLFMSEESIEWLKDEVKKINEEYPEAEVSFNGSILDYSKVPLEQKKENWKNRSNCSGGLSSMTICADGRVILCEQMPHEDIYTAGNLKQQGILDVWHSSRMMEVTFPPKDKFKGTVCFDCDEFDECHNDFGYCFRDALNAYGTIFMPPPNCPKSPPSPRFA